jgi:hypothetical protein
MSTAAFVRFVIVMRDILDRPGNDLLSRVLRHSTISAEKFNGRVRDGIGFWLLAQATGPAKDIGKHKVFFIRARPCGRAPVMFRVLVSRTLIMRTIKPIEQLVPVS